MMIATPVSARDASFALTGGNDTVLQPDSTYTRSLLTLQAPAAHAVTFSFTNSSPAAGATGCFTLAANSAPLNWAGPVPDGPLYAKGTAADVFVVMVGYGGS